MAVYSIRRRTTGVTNATAAAEARTGATERAFLLEINLFLAAATGSTYGIGRPAAIGVTPTAPVTWLAEDPGNAAGTVQTALAWATGPTVPADFHRAIALPATIGSGVIWTFPKGLVIPVSGGYVLWNLATNGVVDLNVVGDE